MVLQAKHHGPVSLAALALLLLACEDVATAPDPLGSASGEVALDGLAVGTDSSGAVAQSFVIVRREVVRGGGVIRGSTRTRSSGDTFVCSNPEECHEECPGPTQDGWTTVCSCKPLGDEFSCVVRRYAPGEEIPGLGDGGGGCGGSGGSGGGGVQADCTASFDLTCDSPVPRGSTVECEVKTTDLSGERDSINYSWSSWGSTGDTTTSSGQGPSNASWGGVAIDGRTIEVKLTGPATQTLTANVEVTVRTGFSFSQLKADVDTVSGAGWSGGKWGHHNPGGLVPPRFVPGSGPWAGVYMLEAPPSLNNVIEVHSDFAQFGALYPGAYAAADSLCGRPQPPIPDTANVYTVNDKCQSLGNLQAWHGLVLAHERAHEKSGNACLASGTAAVKVLQDLESLTGNAGYVTSQPKSMWDNFYNTALEPAFESGILSPRSPYIWDYRFAGSWIYGSLYGPSHGGRWGC